MESMILWCSVFWSIGLSIYISKQFSSKTTGIISGICIGLGLMFLCTLFYTWLQFEIFGQGITSVVYQMYTANIAGAITMFALLIILPIVFVIVALSQDNNWKKR